MSQYAPKVAWPIDKKEFFNEICRSKALGKITPRALDLYVTIATRLCSALSYKNPDDRDDCISFAIMDFIAYWKNFNPERSTNAFSFFTQMAKNGLTKGFKKFHTPIDSGKVSLDVDEGVYNI